MNRLAATLAVAVAALAPATPAHAIPVNAQVLDESATAHEVAVRTSPPAPQFGGDRCAEMSFYREQAGLPARFDTIGYRESRCRNEDSVRTFCCYGWWQNFISSHLSTQSAYRDRIINECGVTSYRDINSDTPDDKYRQACVTYVVWSISGLSPWSTS